ncbi:hypothetical protein DCAR_0311046 [Daucus carota subsp. sativus]|uniref:Bidirectional sugar transporter SWEET n=1 Tax=Daucus carota subsp. sativus TaxID=79200 RepID=A0A166AC54_DAUCS|nr:PREDICTED: bidirectional sugar transporter SWEET5-like [Daucus carota subsp. sativus]XP_017241677.1 PREDICTED: bidirectional sugar transporter SWEET5-like [Daucus carota subsp. sativus]WOG91794.1 hypothetical protein DCAR_0311046 [Daucus carota subsp. sativus]
MVHAKLIVRAVFGIIGNIISFGLFASPVPTFYRVIKTNSVNEVKPKFHLLATMNCLLWVLFSMPFVCPGNILLLTANGFGVVMHLAYLIIFLIYATDNERMYKGGVLLVELAVIGVVSGLVTGLVDDISRRRFIMGLLCVYSAFMMYLSRFFHVVVDESADYMPFPVVVTNTLNDLCWIFYGSLGFDVIVLFAYGLGFIVGVIQLARHVHSNKIPDDKKLAAADVQLQGMA